MPSVNTSEKTKKYLDKIRRKAPGDKVLSLKEITGYAIVFIEKHEDEFLESIKKEKGKD